MRKLLFKSVTVIVMLCLALFCFAACSDSDDEPNDGKFDAVNAASIKITERDTGIFVSWDDVPMATGYYVTCNSYKMETPSSFINLSQQQGFTLPADGVLNISIVAKSYGFTDSDPVEITYKATGVTLNSPQIKSLNNGVLEWNRVVGATAYKVSVNGSTVSENYRETSLNVSNYASASGVLKIEITAKSNNAKYLIDSVPTTIGVDTAKSRLTLLPVDTYELKDGVITWQPVGGAATYRVVDLNMTVVKNIKADDTLRYDMVGYNLILGVFPTSSDKAIADAPITPMDIKYLDGEGTAEKPYLIKTAFDLRAVDYYEVMYAEKYAKELAAGTAPEGNHYRIANNINFNSVAALDADSNIFMLSKPFYGYLDGDYKKLSNVRVMYDGGYWALFDYISPNATVCNITIDSAEIENVLQKPDRPLGGSVAAIAKFNYGTISGITLIDARFSAMAGSVSGICTHNYGAVKNCEVSGEFIQISIEVLSPDEDLKINQACFEMAGVVLENYGVVSHNRVSNLTIRGNSCKNMVAWIEGDYGSIVEVTEWGDPYNNVRCAGGIVSVNRASGKVSDNEYATINFVKVNADIVHEEFGGMVAYNAGEVNFSTNKVGKLTWSDTDAVGVIVDSEQYVGGDSDHRGTVVGKSDGTVVQG